MDTEEFVDARLQLHHAVQAIAAFGAHLADAQPDDSHRAMTWRSEPGVFLSAPVRCADGRELRMAVRPSPAALCIVLDGHVSAESSLHGRALAEVFDWACGAAQEALGRPVPEFGLQEYDIPEHQLKECGVFDASADALGALADGFRNAGLLLQEVVDGEDHAEPVRVWPHHFDMATRIRVDGADAPDGAVINVGLTPGDEGTPLPYWYVSPWPRPDDSDVPSLDVGRWVTDGWFGAMLATKEVWAISDRGAEAQAAHVRRFLTEGLLKARLQL